MIPYDNLQTSENSLRLYLFFAELNMKGSF